MTNTTNVLVAFPAVVVRIPYQNPGITAPRTFHFRISQPQGKSICGPSTLQVTILPFVAPNTPTNTFTATSTPTNTSTATSTLTETPTQNTTPVGIPPLLTPRSFLPLMQHT
jgi:hypothetical protein